jgi:hypothetical protein
MSDDNHLAEGETPQAPEIAREYGETPTPPNITVVERGETPIPPPPQESGK